LIEGLWGWLKSNVVNNVFFSEVHKICIAIRSFIETINKVPKQVIERALYQIIAIFIATYIDSIVNEKYRSK